MYTVMQPQPANLMDREIAVQLDDGTCAAVRPSIIPQADGSSIVTTQARAINADGSGYLDPLAHAVLTIYSIPVTDELTAACGGPDKLQKLALMVVLGEPCAPLPVDAESAARLSIKAKLSAIKALAQPDTASLLG